MNQQPNQSTSTAAETRTGGEPTQAAVPDNTAREEKERVFERIEREMGIYRKGECSRFQASSRIANELAEISNSLTRGTTSPPATTTSSSHPGQRSTGKRIRDQVEEQVSGEGRGKSARKRANLKEEDMPWFNSTLNSSRRPSCIKTNCRWPPRGNPLNPVGPNPPRRVC